jgi:hypothetical protein
LLDAKVDGGSIKRSDSPDAVVEDVTFELTTEALDVTIGEKATVTTLDLQIPSARVTDMSVYNAFIPNTAPLTLLSGQAQLVADVHLEPESAGGYLRLKTKGLRTRLNDQELSGELNFNINLNGGTPNDMKYDISGSSLDLSEMTIAGSTENFEQTDWSAHVNFKKAQVVWKQPMSIDAEAELEMKNSRPIVAILANQKGKHGWIEKLMTVENIKGKAKFAMNSEAIVIPYAIAGGGKISVGAKGVIDEKSSEGVFFARYGKLKGILKINDDRSNFDIIGAQKKFDNYEPFAVPGSEQKK